MTHLLSQALHYTSNFERHALAALPAQTPLNIPLLTCTSRIFGALAPRVSALRRTATKHFSVDDGEYSDFFQHLVIADRDDSACGTARTLSRPRTANETERRSCGRGQDEIMPDNVFIDAKTVALLGMADSFVFTRSMIFISEFPWGWDDEENDDDEEEEEGDDDDNKYDEEAIDDSNKNTSDALSNFQVLRNQVHSALFRLFQLESFALSDTTCRSAHHRESTFIRDADLRRIFQNNAESLEHVYFHMVNSGILSFSLDDEKCEAGKYEQLSVFSLLPHLRTLDFGQLLPQSENLLSRVLNSISQSPHLRKNLQVLRLHSFNDEFSEESDLKCRHQNNNNDEIFRLTSFTALQQQHLQEPENNNNNRILNTPLYFASLRKLDLGECVASFFDDSVLACIHGDDFPSLQWLSLKGLSLISDAGVEQAIPTLASSLRHLDLSGMDSSKLTNRSLDFVGECILLESLCLGNFFGGTTVLRLPAGGRGGSGGRGAINPVATMGGGDLTSNGIERLKNLKKLTFLDLNDQRKIDTTAMLFLARNNSALKHLGLDMIAAVSKVGFPNDFGVGDEASDYLVKNLESLSLCRSHGYVDQVLNDLCAAQNLKRLDISGCSMVREAHLLNFFSKFNKGLKFEELRLAQLAEAVTDRVVDAICSNHVTTLRHLDLESVGYRGQNPSALTPASLKILGEKLISHPESAIEVLLLRGQQKLAETPQDWQIFFGEFIGTTNNSRLRELGLDSMGSDFTQDCLQVFAERNDERRQTFLPAVDTVRLYGNTQLKKNEMEHLRKKMPDVDFMWYAGDGHDGEIRGDN